MTPTNWMKSNLAGLGSAAVLTVYAAGYVKTKPAADRFANESDERRRSTTPIQPVSHVEIAAPAAPAAPAPTTPTTVAAPVAEAKPAPEKHAVAEPKKTAAAPIKDSATTVAAAPTAAPSPAPVAPSTPAPQPAAQPQPAPADSVQKEQVGFKDGIYYGWGSSRHGDIQAAVEIKNGRILSAVITQCLTQYSCSWISPLPPQVVQRQSPEVDYVSGATQSTNAFYYAVVQALKQAK